MMRTFNAVKVISYIIAIVVILGGMYILCYPFVPAIQQDEGGTSALHKALVSTPSLICFGILYLAPGIGLFLGTWKNWLNVSKHSLFVIYIMIFFAQIINIITNGAIRPTWLSPTALGLIAAVIWLQIQRDSNNND